MKESKWILAAHLLGLAGCAQTPRKIAGQDKSRSVASEKIVRTCRGTKSKIHVQHLSSDDPNSREILRIRKGYDGDGEVLLERPMNAPEGPGRKFPENAEFFFDVLPRPGGFEIYSPIGEFYRNRPTDPSTGVVFLRPVTWLKVKEDNVEFAEFLNCEN